MRSARTLSLDLDAVERRCRGALTTANWTALARVRASRNAWDVIYTDDEGRRILLHVAQRLDARRWNEFAQALTQRDFDRIVAIGRPNAGFDAVPGVIDVWTLEDLEERVGELRSRQGRRAK